MPMPHNKTEDDITAEALQRFAQTPDPRLREIMLSLIGHLHAFVKEVKLTEAEWFQAIEILTEAGRMCSDKRQEFILFSDTLGVSMVVDLLSHRKPDGATESTVFGPFHRQNAPELPAGGNIAHLDTKGPPTLVSGRVLGLDGKPIAGALLDVWQAQSSGLYDSQDPNLHELHMRGKFRTDAEGRYLLRTVSAGQLPDPVGRPGRRDAARHRPASVASGAHPFRGFGRRLRAGDDASLRPHRRVSRQRCGVRGQGIADLRFRPARDRRWRGAAARDRRRPTTPRSSISASNPLPRAARTRSMRSAGWPRSAPEASATFLSGRVHSH